MTKNLFKNWFGALLTICVLALTLSCERLAPEIDFKQSTNIDFQNIVDKLSQINDAIQNGNLSLAQKLAILEEAVKQGTITQKEGYEKIVQAINLSAQSTEAKMELLKEALLAQTTSLSDKLGILEAAMQAGITSGKENTALLIEAIAEQVEAIKDQTGTIESILDSIGDIIEDGNTTLASKLALLEAAVQAGIASQEESTDQMIAAINAMADSTGNRLDAINDALESGALDITTALSLIDATVKTGLADQSSQLSLIRNAIGSMNLSLADKLSLVQKAVNDGAVTQVGALNLIETALGNLNTDLGNALGQLENAMSSGGDLATKLGAIEAALTLGLMDGTNSRLKLIETAIASMDGDLQTKLDALQAALTGQSGLSTKLATIATAVDNLKASNKDALTLIQTALGTLDGDLKTKSDAIVAAIAALPGNDGGATTVFELFKFLENNKYLYDPLNNKRLLVPEFVMDRKLYEANDNYEFRKYLLQFLADPKYEASIGDTDNYTVSFDGVSGDAHTKFDFAGEGKAKITKIYEFAEFTITNINGDAAYNIQSLYIKDYNKINWPQSGIPGGYIPTNAFRPTIQTNLIFNEYYNGGGQGNYDATKNEVTFKAKMISSNLNHSISIVETCIRRRGNLGVPNYLDHYLNVDIPSEKFHGTLDPIHKETSTESVNI